jgi:hypothetical protein
MGLKPDTCKAGDQGSSINLSEPKLEMRTVEGGHSGHMKCGVHTQPSLLWALRKLIYTRPRDSIWLELSLWCEINVLPAGRCALQLITS